MTLPKGTIKNLLSKNDVTKTPFIMFQAHKDDYQDLAQTIPDEAQNSPLSFVFFHPENIKLIQKRLIKEVFNRTKGEYLIEKQDENDLRVIMNYIISGYSNKALSNVKQQVAELNDLVVNEIVPDILSELHAYFHYLERAFGSAQILDRPKNVSNSGFKTLPSTTKIFDYGY